jgi:resuscitation-promoting factor RpfA
VRCPKCQRESKDGTTFCPGCGAPLALRPEVPTRRLDATIALDRRGGGPRPGGAPAAAERAAPLERATASAAARPEPGLGALADLDRSHWDLRAALGAPAADRTFSGVPLAEGGGSPSPPAIAPARPARAVIPDAGPGIDPRELEPDDLDVREGPLEIHLRRAGSGRRAASWAIDGGLFAALYAAALALVYRGVGPADASAWHTLDLALEDGAGVALPLLAGVAILGFVYLTLCHGLAGATLGQGLLALRVVGPGGARPSLARSATRAALAIVSVLLLGLGLLLALFTESGRALHDLLAGTWVVEPP